MISSRALLLVLVGLKWKLILDIGKISLTKQAQLKVHLLAFSELAFIVHYSQKCSPPFIHYV